jgi:hypothetical protein
VGRSDHRSLTKRVLEDRNFLHLLSSQIPFLLFFILSGLGTNSLQIQIYYYGNNHTTDIGECIQKFPDEVDNEIYAYNNKQSLRNNAKCSGGRTH